MSRDYKSQKSSRSSSKKGGSAFLGGFVGYALGIMSAIGIWLYLNYGPSPYLANDKNATATIKNEPLLKSEPQKTTPPETPITVVEEKPRFDFYKILPGVDEPEMERVAPQRSVPPPQLPPALPSSNKPQENVVKPAEKQPTLHAAVAPTIRTQELPPATQTAPSTPKNNAVVNTPKEKFFLQAGSFKTKGDAENLKARLALIGMLASVQPIDLAERGTWHRVRVGPFTKKEDVDQANASLKENGIAAQFIKVQ